MGNARKNPRQPKSGVYALNWSGADQQPCSILGRGLDISDSGVGIECTRAIASGTIVHVKGLDGFVIGEYCVQHCTRRGMTFHIGFQFQESAKSARSESTAPKAEASADVDYYDVLQISTAAQFETIHRVYRIMAVRFHPDNAESGDLETFLRLRQAYEVLSDPVRRAEYDAKRAALEPETMPIFELKDFVTGVEAEANRRLGVLSLLYCQRRNDPHSPGIGLLELESRMGFPREYLTFTLWYLRAKDLVAAADNSEYSLNAAGVDFVELNAPNNVIMTQLLNRGSVLHQNPKIPSKGKPDQASGSESPFPAEAREKADEVPIRHLLPAADVQ